MNFYSPYDNSPGSQLLPLPSIGGGAGFDPETMTRAGYLKILNDQRGLTPVVIEPALLLERIEQGGDSGQFLADAFLSAYRIGHPFSHSLSELAKLDAEAFRLFHGILHMRHTPGWSDDALYEIEQKIIKIQGVKK